MGKKVASDKVLVFREASYKAAVGYYRTLMGIIRCSALFAVAWTAVRCVRGKMDAVLIETQWLVCICRSGVIPKPSGSRLSSAVHQNFMYRDGKAYRAEHRHQSQLKALGGTGSAAYGWSSRFCLYVPAGCQRLHQGGDGGFLGLLSTTVQGYPELLSVRPCVYGLVSATWRTSRIIPRSPCQKR